MKRKLISLILCITMVSGLFLFVGCGNRNGYNLNNLQKDYLQVANNLECVDINRRGEIDLFFNTQSQIENIQPYAKLNSYYTVLFNNAMSFTYEYIDECADNSIKASTSVKNSLRNSITRMNESLRKVNTSLIGLNGIVWSVINTEGIAEVSKSPVCLSRLENVFYNYEELIVSAVNLSQNLANLYYNYALSSSNSDISKLTLAEFDVERAVLTVQTRTKHQIVNLTESYLNTYVLGAGLAEYYTTPIGTTFYMVEANFSSYTASVDEIYVAPGKVTAAISRIQSVTSEKNDFYNASIELFNVQCLLINDFAPYQTAVGQVKYVTIKNDLNATAHQKLCAEIIENHNQLISEYQNILTRLVDMIVK